MRPAIATALLFLSFVAGCGTAPEIDAGAGAVDAGTVDGGSDDAGTVDAGAVDAGTVDAGPFDAGPFDAGLFVPNARFASLGDNEAIDLGPIAIPGPPGEGTWDRITDYSGLTYDATQHRLLMFGGGHATVQTSGLYEFSFTTLRWAPLYALTASAQMTCANFNREHGSWTVPVEQPLSRHTYDLLEAPPGPAREFWMFKGGDAVNGQAATNMATTCIGTSATPNIYWSMGPRSSVYSSASGRWEFPLATFATGWGSMAVEYDPLGAQIVGLGANGVYALALSTRTVRQLTNGNPTAALFNDETHLTWSSVDDAFYFFSSNRTLWKLVLSRTDSSRYTLAQVAFTGPTPSGTSGGLGYDYDSRHRIIGGGVKGGRFYVYDPLTTTFTAEVATLPDLLFHTLAYNPVDNVFVYVGADRHTWAYRYRR